MKEKNPEIVTLAEEKISERIEVKTAQTNSRRNE